VVTKGGKVGGKSRREKDGKKAIPEWEGGGGSAARGFNPCGKEGRPFYVERRLRGEMRSQKELGKKDGKSVSGRGASKEKGPNLKGKRIYKRGKNEVKKSLDKNDQNRERDQLGKTQPGGSGQSEKGCWAVLVRENRDRERVQEQTKKKPLGGEKKKRSRGEEPFRRKRGGESCPSLTKK